VDEVADGVLGHLRQYGSLTEEEVVRLAGSARAYRRLRAYLHDIEAPLRIDTSGTATVWYHA